MFPRNFYLNSVQTFSWFNFIFNSFCWRDISFNTLTVRLSTLSSDQCKYAPQHKCFNRVRFSTLHESRNGLVQIINVNSLVSQIGLTKHDKFSETSQT